MKPPVGLSDFRALIEFKDPQGEPYLFVDKSLFAKEIIDDPSSVILINRPRRFGKTLNLSLLHHFFANEIDDKSTADLFLKLKIYEHKEYMKYQGQFPVIFLTFKDIKANDFNTSYEKFRELIRELYRTHEKPVKSSSELSNSEKEDYQLILDKKASDTDISNSLKKLTYYLNKVYGVKPIVLIDEYDTPIQAAYLEKYYKEMVTFMREFLGAGLKDNTYLNKAILTGILRVSKESLFSGLNNLSVYTLLDSHYGEYFGFTEIEVIKLLEKTSLKKALDEVRNWYNGYQAGNIVIYNPWSIVNYIHKKGQLQPYWVNTSDNALIKDLIIQSSTHFKAQFESLLQGEAVERLMSETIVFNHLEGNESALWTLLLMSGYLKVTSIKQTDQGPNCQLEIPNKEVKGLYQMFIAQWLSGLNDANAFNIFLNDLLNGNMENFEEHLRRITLQTFSIHDVTGKQAEKFYHGFMLGLVSGVDNYYKIESNKEAGLGRYDIILAPNDLKKIGIILEIKSIDSMNPEALKQAANDAIEQIDKRQYTATPILRGITNFLKIGIAFSGKELVLTYRKETQAHGAT